MNNSLLIRLGILGLFTLAVVYTTVNFSRWGEEEAVEMQIISLTVLGLAGAVLFVVYVLPMLGDLIGGSFYTGSEELRMDPSMKAAAKVSAGDYEGAIDEYMKLAEESPEDAFPIVEAARVALEKLDDPQKAATILIGSLEAADEAAEAGNPMDLDSHASLHFRLAEIHVNRFDDHESAIELMNTVAEKFPETRHATNASYKKQEWKDSRFLE